MIGETFRDMGGPHEEVCRRQGIDPADAQDASTVYCHECSKAGGADRPIYHTPPACGSPALCAWCGFPEDKHGPPGESDMAIHIGNPTLRLCPNLGKSNFYTQMPQSGPGIAFYRGWRILEQYEPAKGMVLSASKDGRSPLYRRKSLERLLRDIDEAEAAAGIPCMNPVHDLQQLGRELGKGEPHYDRPAQNSD